MEVKRKHIIYKEEFRRQAVEMVIHSGKTQAQVARELGCSEYSLNLWKKAYLRQQALAEIRRLQKENEYLKIAARDPISGAVNRESGNLLNCSPLAGIYKGRQ